VCFTKLWGLKSSRKVDRTNYREHDCDWITEMEAAYIIRYEIYSWD